MHWWEIDQAQGPAKVRAVAYYRHSAQDRQENSIPIQRDQVREWAEQNGVEIIREFADHGKSGLNAEDRPVGLQTRRRRLPRLAIALPATHPTSRHGQSRRR